MDFIRNVYILSKLDQKPVLDFHWILYWIIGGFLLNIKSTRFYVKFTRFPHLGPNRLSVTIVCSPMLWRSHSKVLNKQFPLTMKKGADAVNSILILTYLMSISCLLHPKSPVDDIILKQQFQFILMIFFRFSKQNTQLHFIYHFWSSRVRFLDDISFSFQRLFGPWVFESDHIVTKNYCAILWY